MATRKRKPTPKSKSKAKPAREETPVSAQVILRSRGGKPVRAASVTAENVQQILPDPEKVRDVAAWFAEHGFDVAHAVGTSFSITAPKETFERVFETKLANRKTLALPLAPIDRRVADEVEEVTFTPPPDFGPTSY